MRDGANFIPGCVPSWWWVETQEAAAYFYMRARSFANRAGLFNSRIITMNLRKRLVIISRFALCLQFNMLSATEIEK